MVQNQIWAELFLLASFMIVLGAIVVAAFTPARCASYGSFALAAAAYLALTVYPGAFTKFPVTRATQWLNDKLTPIRSERWTPDTNQQIYYPTITVTNSPYLSVPPSLPPVIVPPPSYPQPVPLNPGQQTPDGAIDEDPSPTITPPPPIATPPVASAPIATGPALVPTPVTSYTVVGTTVDLQTAIENTTAMGHSLFALLLGLAAAYVAGRHVKVPRPATEPTATIALRGDRLE